MSGDRIDVAVATARALNWISAAEAAELAEVGRVDPESLGTILYNRAVMASGSVDEIAQADTFKAAFDDRAPLRIMASAGRASADGMRHAVPWRSSPRDASDNPLLDALVSSPSAWVAASAQQEAGPAPGIFGGADFPSFTASGLPVDALRDIPPWGRAAVAAAPSLSAAHALATAFADPETGEALAAEVASGRATSAESAAEMVGPSADAAGVVAAIRSSRPLIQNYSERFERWARGPLPPSAVHVVEDDGSSVPEHTTEWLEGLEQHVRDDPRGKPVPVRGSGAGPAPSGAEGGQ